MAMDAQDPAESVVALTKSDTTVYVPAFRGLYVGGSGDVAVRMKDGTSATFSAVPAGAVLSIRIDKLLSTGTTATLVMGLG